jgi:hypothetical protein
MKYKNIKNMDEVEAELSILKDIMAPLKELKYDVLQKQLKELCTFLDNIRNFVPVNCIKLSIHGLGDIVLQYGVWTADESGVNDSDESVKGGFWYITKDYDAENEAPFMDDGLVMLNEGLYLPNSPLPEDFVEQMIGRISAKIEELQEAKS